MLVNPSFLYYETVAAPLLSPAEAAPFGQGTFCLLLDQEDVKLVKCIMSKLNAYMHAGRNEKNTKSFNTI